MKDYPHSFGQVDGERFTLVPEEAQHLAQVLRMNPGDRIIGLDGQGSAYEVELEVLTRKLGHGIIVQTWKDYGKVDGHLHVAMAPPKSQDRLNTFLEKAIEMGIHEFTPIIADRSERRKMNVDRLHRVAVAACKQSHKGKLPVIHEPIALQTFLAHHSPGAIAVCFGEREGWDSYLQRTESCTLLIGPEGDFSPSELQLATDKGWTAIHLGPHRLRTETAGLQAVAHYAGWINRS